MSFKDKVNGFFDKYVFSAKWKCNVCGKEIFNEGYFCKECEDSFPLILDERCRHCGRRTKVSVDYCSTCKLSPTNFEIGRSVFDYGKPIDTLIQRFKYGDGRYFAEIFSVYLAKTYSEMNFNADYLTFIPMSRKARRKRGYNQAELLVRDLSKRISVPIYDGIIKTKETKRQATLSHAERIKNLEGTFKVKYKKLIKGKKVLIIDDVTTTGSTIEVVAKTLKNAGAFSVGFLTVASVASIDKI